MSKEGGKSKLLTFPQLRREYGLGLRTLRREAAQGAFPLYWAGTKWPRVLRAEFESWLRSTRMEPAELARAKNSDPRPG